MRTVVYVDGQNFLYKIAERLMAVGLVSDKQEVSAIDIPYLLQQILPNEQMEIRYYGVSKIYRQEDYGEEILEKSIRFANNLRRLRNCLNKTGVKYCGIGALKVRDRDECKKCGATDYKFQEKGVDVGLAINMVMDVLKDEVDHVVLVSSDTDLLPAVRVARDAKKRITYIGFDNRITRLLSALTASTYVIRNNDIVEAYRRMFD